MLPWPQQRPRKRSILLAKLCLYSGLIHVILCFALFFMYKSYKPDMILNVHASDKSQDVIVRLLPLTAKKPVQKKQAGGGLVKKVKAVIKKKSTTQFKKIKKVVPKKIVPVKKAVAEKKIAKADPVKKIDKKPEVKKVATAKSSKVEKLVKEKKIEPKKLVEKKEEKKDLVVQEDLREEENVRYVTHKELRGLQLERALQQAVQEVWSPPVGIDESVASEVQVTVGWDGVLVESQVIKLTNIVIYDVAVQEALEEIKFPREVWGKEIKIAFRP